MISKRILALVTFLLLVSAPTFSQELDYCQGDFDYDGDQDGTDAAVFKSDFGRSGYTEPCPCCQVPVPQLWEKI